MRGPLCLVLLAVGACSGDSDDGGDDTDGGGELAIAGEYLDEFGTEHVITEAEWKIMRLLWRKSPQPAYDLIQQLESTEQWHPNTVKTMLTRLHRKKVVGIKKYKNLYLYEPLVSEEECIQAESQTFLDRFFDGSVRPLLVHFARRQKLSKADLDELRKILEGKDKK